MKGESGYLPLQQPKTGYNALGGTNYGAQQTTTFQYKPQQSPASGGRGKGSQKATGSSKLNIRVHPKSMISAQAWIKKIKDNNHIPEYYQEQIKSSGNAIYVTNPKRFKVPNNVISKPWMNDWLSAFVTPKWEITTGCLDIHVENKSSSGKKLTIIHKPDLSTGESIDQFTQYTMTKVINNIKGAEKVEEVPFEKGNTLPTGTELLSKRKLIVIANRIALKLGSKIKTFEFNDDELLEVWFHEIACHAGRNSRGVPDTHGNKAVESCSNDIQGMFPKTKTIPMVITEIVDYLNL
jgi:hypothetical protein